MYIDKSKFLPDIYIAGEITDVKDGIRLHTKGGNIHDLKAQGWTHFG
jgi:thiamine-monophosphate kinase